MFENLANKEKNKENKKDAKNRSTIIVKNGKLTELNKDPKCKEIKSVKVLVNSIKDDYTVKFDKKDNVEDQAGMTITEAANYGKINPFKLLFLISAFLTDDKEQVDIGLNWINVKQNKINPVYISLKNDAEFDQNSAIKNIRINNKGLKIIKDISEKYPTFWNEIEMNESKIKLSALFERKKQKEFVN